MIDLAMLEMSGLRRARSKERKMGYHAGPPKERRAHKTRVECCTMLALFLSIIAIFLRLREQRKYLPHELRSNPDMAPLTKPHFHIVHIVVRLRERQRRR